MTSQMTEMQREVDDKLKIEAALKAAEQARKAVCWGDPSLPRHSAAVEFVLLSIAAFVLHKFPS